MSCESCSSPRMSMSVRRRAPRILSLSAISLVSQLAFDSKLTVSGQNPSFTRLRIATHRCACESRVGQLPRGLATRISNSRCTRDQLELCGGIDTSETLADPAHHLAREGMSSFAYSKSLLVSTSIRVVWCEAWTWRVTPWPFRMRQDTRGPGGGRGMRHERDQREGTCLSLVDQMYRARNCCRSTSARVNRMYATLLKSKW